MKYKVGDSLVWWCEFESRYRLCKVEYVEEDKLLGEHYWINVNFSKGGKTWAKESELLTFREYVDRLP